MKITRDQVRTQLQPVRVLHDILLRIITAEDLRLFDWYHVINVAEEGLQGLSDVRSYVEYHRDIPEETP